MPATKTVRHRRRDVAERHTLLARARTHHARMPSAYARGCIHAAQWTLGRQTEPVAATYTKTEPQKPLRALYGTFKRPPDATTIANAFDTAKWWAEQRHRCYALGVADTLLWIQNDPRFPRFLFSAGILLSLGRGDTDLFSQKRYPKPPYPHGKKAIY